MFKYLMSSLMSTYENQDLLDMLYKTTHINCKEKICDANFANKERVIFLIFMVFSLLL